MDEVVPNVAVLAGEVSGDVVGGALVAALRRICPHVHVWGMGGRHLAREGVELIADSDRWGTIGIVEALRVYPELRYGVYPRVKRALRERRPAAAVLIDFGAFNMRVAHVCRALGVPVLYYMPPGSWRRRGPVKPDLPALATRIATPFPWSADRLREAGASVEFVGHPLLELVRPTMERHEFARRFGMDASEAIVGLLPGSRVFEVESNTPAQLGAADLVHTELPRAQFVVGCASDTARRCVEAALTKWSRQRHGPRVEDRSRKPRVHAGSAHGAWQLVTPDGVRFTPEELAERDRERRQPGQPQGLPPVVLTQGLTHDLMAHSDVLIVCSGTATLEAAILGTPMVIMYRGTQLMQVERIVRRIRPEHIGMPSIVAGRRVTPELIQHEASPEALAEHALCLLRDPAARAQARRGLEGVRAALGTPGASERTARMVVELGRLECGRKEA